MSRRGLPKYCYAYQDRHGKLRYKFQRKGFTAALPVPSATEFAVAYENALNQRPNVKPIGIEHTQPGSFRALKVAYFSSPEYLKLTQRTKQCYLSALRQLPEALDEQRVTSFKKRHIKAIVAKFASRPQTGNRILSILKVIFELAKDLEMIRDNPARSVKGYTKKTDGYHTWTREELAKFISTHPKGTKAYLALMLLYYTAQRRSDVVKMGWQHVNNGTLRIRQQKTGNWVELPITPQLEAAIISTPRDNLTFLINQYGRPYTAGGFGNWFRTLCNQAGLPQCSSHGIRKAASAHMAEDGSTTNEIASITGHAKTSEVDTYTREARKSKLAKRAIRNLKGVE